jgi:hypothetical protein
MPHGERRRFYCLFPARARHGNRRAAALDGDSAVGEENWVSGRVGMRGQEPSGGGVKEGREIRFQM